MGFKPGMVLDLGVEYFCLGTFRLNLLKQFESMVVNFSSTLCLFSKNLHILLPLFWRPKRSSSGVSGLICRRFESKLLSYQSPHTGKKLSPLPLVSIKTSQQNFSSAMTPLNSCTWPILFAPLFQTQLMFWLPQKLLQKIFQFQHQLSWNGRITWDNNLR